MASLRREGVTMYEMELSVNELWRHIRQEAKGLVEQEPLLASFLHATIIGHSDLRGACPFCWQANWRMRWYRRWLCGRSLSRPTAPRSG